MKKQTVKFYPEKPEYIGVLEPPVPSNSVLPDWYKHMEKYTGNQKVTNPETGNLNVTVKSCMPIFDLITAGYMFTNQVEISFNKIPDGFDVSWTSNTLKAIESHPPAQYRTLTVPDGYHNWAYKFINPWVMKTPKGYSTLFMQPAHRDDLPFQILPAIVDTDKHPKPVNFPFFIRKDFEGILPIGMPIMQAIPFKRDEWNIKAFTKVDPALEIEWAKAEGKIMNRYKHYFRTIKRWN